MFKSYRASLWVASHPLNPQKITCVRGRLECSGLQNRALCDAGSIPAGRAENIQKERIIMEKRISHLVTIEVSLDEFLASVTPEEEVKLKQEFVMDVLEGHDNFTYDLLLLEKVWNWMAQDPQPFREHFSEVSLDRDTLHAIMTEMMELLESL
jgi:hypothetical protein